jgi:hypothetical protein
MTHFPGDGVLPTDDSPPEQHATEMVDYYMAITDQVGEIFLPANPENQSSEWADLANHLGATWLYTAKHNGSWTLDLDEISKGPPSS